MHIFIPGIVFKQSNILIFPKVKMSANNSEICREGNLEADSQQILLVYFFWNFHIIVVKHQ